MTLSFVEVIRVLVIQVVASFGPTID